MRACGGVDAGTGKNIYTIIIHIAVVGKTA